MRFLKELGELIKPIMDQVDFEVKTVNWACPTCDTDFKRKHCISNGAYCAMQKQGSAVDGKVILNEDLRQMCLMQTLNPVGLGGGPDKRAFFDYITTAHEYCPYSYINEKCSKLGLEGIEFKEDLLNACIKSSYASGGKQSPTNDPNQIF